MESRLKSSRLWITLALIVLALAAGLLGWVPMEMALNIAMIMGSVYVGGRSLSDAAKEIAKLILPMVQAWLERKFIDKLGAGIEPLHGKMVVRVDYTKMPPGMTAGDFQALAQEALEDRLKAMGQ